MSVVTVSEWPTYLLKSVPRDVRAGIERDAGTGSMIEVVRAILCARYSLDCEPVLMRNRFLTIDGTETMILRLQPELWTKIKHEAARRKIPHRSVIIEALTDHYKEVVT